MAFHGIRMLAGLMLVALLGTTYASSYLLILGFGAIQPEKQG